MFKESFYDKIEKKTNVNKDTILSLANKVQQADMKDPTVISNLINEISGLTGKEVSEEKKKKIIDTVVNDNIPSDLGKNL